MAARRKSSRAERHVALLRGINVGGKNKLPMKELVAMFEAAGCDEVRTYIQSGNVLFHASAARAERAARQVAAAASEHVDASVPVVLRTASEMRVVARANPFLEQGAEPRSLHVGFLDARPAARRVSSLDPDRSPPDRYLVRGREIYLCCPNGIGRSKLTVTYFERMLETTTTLRNWRTVQTLVEMLDAPGVKGSRR